MRASDKVIRGLSAFGMILAYYLLLLNIVIEYNCVYYKGPKKMRKKMVSTITLEEIRIKYPFTRIYSWWWKSGVGYKQAGELANQNQTDAIMMKCAKAIRAIQETGNSFGIVK